MEFIIKSKTHGSHIVLIDEDDYGKVKHRGWCVRFDKNINKFYVVARSTKQEGNKLLYLHREIMNAKPGEMIDHKDNNSLNNQRSNLRFCNKSTNGMNRESQKNNKTSIYKGVYFEKRRNHYVANIQLNGKNKYLGSFKTEKEAALQYNKFALLLHGEFCCLNKIKENNI